MVYVLEMFFHELCRTYRSLVQSLDNIQAWKSLTIIFPLIRPDSAMDNKFSYLAGPGSDLYNDHCGAAQSLA
jgi:hypothetical protein